MLIKPRHRKFIYLITSLAVLAYVGLAVISWISSSAYDPNLEADIKRNLAIAEELERQNKAEAEAERQRQLAAEQAVREQELQAEAALRAEEKARLDAEKQKEDAWQTWYKPLDRCLPKYGGLDATCINYRLAARKEFEEWWQKQQGAENENAATTGQTDNTLEQPVEAVAE